MSNRGGNPVKTPAGEVYFVMGKLYGGGTAPTAGVMFGATFKRGGTGGIIIYPDVNYAYLISQDWNTVSPAGGNTYKETGSTYYAGQTTGYSGHTAGATAYASCVLSVAGTATDLAAGDELNFILAFARTLKP